MSEIKTSFTKEQVEAWMEENNLAVNNWYQLCAKLMEIESKL